MKNVLKGWLVDNTVTVDNKNDTCCCPVVYFIISLLFVACASAKYVPEEVQANIREQVKERNYRIEFSNFYSFMEESSHLVSDILGGLRIQGDTLFFDFWHPVYKLRGKFKMQDYRQSETRYGETVVTFSIDRPAEMCYKRKDKDVPVPFCLKMRSLYKIEVGIDDSYYKGRFEF